MQQKMKTLPTFGEAPHGEGGLLGAIMRGALVDGVRQPDYAVIVSTAELGDVGKKRWGEYGRDVPSATSLTDGLTNTIAMAAAKCPAALAVHKLKVAGHSDWYIPSRAEMWALRANVPELFPKEIHWTSTQGDSDYAFAQDFAHGGSNWSGKDSEFRVRAVRRIQLQHFNA